MISFFRKIRQSLLTQNKISRYLLYAAGEIILVVIGILIALQINNWNEGRINDQEEALLIKNIIEDLHTDAAHIDLALGELSEQLVVVNELIDKVMGNEQPLDYKFMGLIRFSSDFRPVSQRNHAEAVSNLENEYTRELLQNYFIKEDEVLDMFLEYEDIIHNEIRPYLRNSGMHNLNALNNREGALKIEMLLQPDILDRELKNIKFQQMLGERRLKTESFKRYMQELKVQNQDLIKILSSNNN